MVKINQPETAEKYNIVNSPSLVYFRKKIPLLYDGKYLLLPSLIYFCKLVPLLCDGKYLVLMKFSVVCNKNIC